MIPGPTLCIPSHFWYIVMDSHQPSMLTEHLGLLALEMRIHYLTVKEVELSAELMMLIMHLLLSVVVVVPVSTYMCT